MYEALVLKVFNKLLAIPNSSMKKYSKRSRRSKLENPFEFWPMYLSVRKETGIGVGIAGLGGDKNSPGIRKTPLVPPEKIKMRKFWSSLENVFKRLTKLS